MPHGLPMLVAALEVLGLALRGDVDGNDVVDRQDVTALAPALGTCGVRCPADINGDLRVDPTDLRQLLEILR